MQKVIWRNEPLPENILIPEPHDVPDEGLCLELEDGTERYFCKWTLRTEWIQFDVWLECEPVQES